ncbi:MAG: LysM peptidoglycan-binding domain-containing protein [Acidimicrobiales bacterium]|jgi:LysM repeat protein|nr:LysM peptidoglycan-binding domain-containing protein [Acidimicrobiales bacterium]MDP6298846.1 LysM peptidoglycan-binding domain-containing protein [Acidimicrobiales bacterium]HJM28687.1 LysM peptidoglycan-binding domain-containing protein [Acidimicrobiales bacterium]HJM97483.1 LysM peptidoglycan-binding domain-containing protein [Acidimicrobiales bacterium]
MKKFFGIVIFALLTLGACGGGSSDEAPPASSENDSTVEEETPATETPVVVEPTPTAEVVIPTPAPLIHTVQPGNSLGQIAQSYGVPIEVLAAENGIEDYNLIQVGQEIVIPILEEDEEEEE